MSGDTVKILEKLIATCRDIEAGYRDAAALVQKTELKKFFLQQAQERGRFAGELESVCFRLGDDKPDRGPGFSRRLHRAWIDLREEMGGGDRYILASLTSGEESAHKEFQAALRVALPLHVRAVLERQTPSVAAACNRVRNLRSFHERAA